MFINYFLRSSQNFLHLPAFCQLIHQFVQISNLLRQSIFDFLHPVSTDHSCDEAGIGVEESAMEEKFKSYIFFDQFLQPLPAEACQPLYDLKQFLLCPAFLFYLSKIERIDRSNRHFCDSFILAGCCCHRIKSNPASQHLQQFSQPFYPSFCNRLCLSYMDIFCSLLLTNPLIQMKMAIAIVSCFEVKLRQIGINCNFLCYCWQHVESSIFFILLSSACLFFGNKIYRHIFTLSR